MKTIGIALALALWLPLAAGAQSGVAPEKEAAIRKLMETTGALELGSQLSGALFAQLRPAFPQVPATVWEEMASQLDDMSEFAELMIPVYDRHYSLEDLEALVAFYQTPLGRRVVQATPLIAQESMAIGQRWGQAQALEVIERLRARGYTQQL